MVDPKVDVPNRLHTVVKATIKPFCEQHDLRREYFVDMLNGGRQEHKGWQLRCSIHWLRHVQTGEFVAVVLAPSRGRRFAAGRRYAAVDT